jgi:hypothetical protein
LRNGHPYGRAREEQKTRGERDSRKASSARLRARCLEWQQMSRGWILRTFRLRNRAVRINAKTTKRP